jgi:hypothetical protein
VNRVLILAAAAALVLGMLPGAVAVGNPQVSYYDTYCTRLGWVVTSSVFFASDNPNVGGTTSSFRVVGTNQTIVIYAVPPKTGQEGSWCWFTWNGGAAPSPAYVSFDGWALITPQSAIWDPAMDWHNAPYQQNPSADSLGNPAVWSYMWSSSFAHDPSTYRLLPNYWVEAEQWNDPSYTNLLVGHDNATSSTIRMHSGGGRVNGPEAGNDAILAWTSPVPGRVVITGHLQLGDPACNYLGSGIFWSIDQGATTLYQATVAPGAAIDFTVSANTTNGPTIYFVHDPGWDSNCDTAIVNLTITR